MEDTILRRAWAEIDLDALAHNYQQARRKIGPNVKYLGVVKADAYGHGAIQVSRKLEQLGADYLAVSSLDEAKELRRAGIQAPILILGHTPPAMVPQLIEYRITQAVSALAKAEAYSAAAVESGGTLKVHIKVDTGMSRLGFLVREGHFDTGVESIAAACALPGLEAEGIFTVSCAGGATSCLTVPVKRVPVQGRAWRVGVRGLTGGHSGVEINKGRANANKVLAAALQGLPVTLCSIAGGSKDNAIPRASEAVVVSEADDFAALFAANAAKAALPETEQHAEFYCEPAEAGEMLAESEAVLGLLNAVPNGVQAMSGDIPGLVQTSLNLGILTTDADAVRLTFSVRSSVNREKFGLIDQLKALAARFGGSYSESGEYPAWEYQKDSRLREVMVEVFEAQYGRKPVVEAIHAGLECGIFSDRLPGLDAVSFGPQMHDIHTSREKLDIASTARTWEYLVAVLERL